ncbi:hypothetical protein, partial [Actinocorallia lasiicapitis]
MSRHGASEPRAAKPLALKPRASKHAAPRGPRRRRLALSAFLPVLAATAWTAGGSLGHGPGPE